MNKNFTIISWNACLGVIHKKDYIKTIIKDNSADLVFLQETELPHDINLNLMKIEGYELVTTKTSPKIRTVCYFKSEIKATIKVSDTFEIILISTRTHDFFGLYRPFKLQHGQTHLSYINGLVNFIQENRNQKKKLVI